MTNYHYRSRTENFKITVKSVKQTIQQKLTEFAKDAGLIKRSEVEIQPPLKALPAPN